jgi:hypothetical protein
MTQTYSSDSENLKFVTVAISQKDAESFQDPDGNWVDGSTERLSEACRVALRGKQ